MRRRKRRFAEIDRRRRRARKIINEDVRGHEIAVESIEAFIYDIEVDGIEYVQSRIRDRTVKNKVIGYFEEMIEVLEREIENVSRNESLNNKHRKSHNRFLESRSIVEYAATERETIAESLKTIEDRLILTEETVELAGADRDTTQRLLSALEEVHDIIRRMDAEFF